MTTAIVEQIRDAAKELRGTMLSRMSVAGELDRIADTIDAEPVIRGDEDGDDEVKTKPGPTELVILALRGGRKTEFDLAKYVGYSDLSFGIDSIRDLRNRGIIQQSQDGMYSLPARAQIRHDLTNADGNEPVRMAAMDYSHTPDPELHQASAMRTHVATLERWELP